MTRLISNGEPHLAPLLRRTDYKTTAAALVTCMTRKKRDEFAQKTADVTADGTHAGNNVNSFQISSTVFEKDHHQQLRNTWASKEMTMFFDGTIMPAIPTKERNQHMFRT